MPRFSATDVAHVAATNHLIERRPRRIDLRADEKRNAITSPIVLFPQRRIDLENEESARDLGIALSQFARSNKIPVKPDLYNALEMLSQSSKVFPDDEVLWEERAYLLSMIDGLEEAIGLWEKILHNSPQNEQALLQIGALYQRTQQPEKALECWKKVIALDPWNAGAYWAITPLLMERKEFAEMRMIVGKWLQLVPASVEARQLSVFCLLKKTNSLKLSENFKPSNV